MTHDEIYSTIPPEFTGMVNYNIGNSERIGAEVYAEHYIGDLTLKSSVTYLHHKVISGKYSGSKIPSVPNWKLTFGAGYDFNSNFSVGADAIYAGNTYDLDDIANDRKRILENTLQWIYFHNINLIMEYLLHLESTMYLMKNIMNMLDSGMTVNMA